MPGAGGVWVNVREVYVLCNMPGVAPAISINHMIFNINILNIIWLIDIARATPGI